MYWKQRICLVFLSSHQYFEWYSKFWCYKPQFWTKVLMYYNSDYSLIHSPIQYYILLMAHLQYRSILTKSTRNSLFHTLSSWNLSVSMVHCFLHFHHCLNSREDYTNPVDDYNFALTFSLQFPVFHSLWILSCAGIQAKPAPCCPSTCCTLL